MFAALQLLNILNVYRGRDLREMELPSFASPSSNQGRALFNEFANFLHGSMIGRHVRN